MSTDRPGTQTFSFEDGCFVRHLVAVAAAVFAIIESDTAVIARDDRLVLPRISREINMRQSLF